MSNILKRGSRGINVESLQSKLNTIYPSLGSTKYAPSFGILKLETDGVFGKITEAWVEEFQTRNYLKVDGKVGPNTWRALNLTPSSVHKIPTKSIILYIHSDDTGEYGITFTKHKTDICLHEKFSSANLTTKILDQLKQNNYKIKEFVINTHGGGGGTIYPFTMGGARIKLSNPSFTNMVYALKPYFTTRSVISIYACSIASFKDGEEDGPRIYAEGIKEMKLLARKAGIPVKGGFIGQNSLTGRFVGPWVQINSAGYWTVNKGTATYLEGVWDKIKLKIKEIAGSDSCLY